MSVDRAACAPIALLTDFGLHDGYVGVMKGVILGIAPAVPLLDLTHDIAPQNIAQGAWVLGTSYRYFPRHTVFICVVDPGVGSTRRPMAFLAGEWFFVGPDNGLFTQVLAEQTVSEAVALTNPVYHLPQVSATFQGRDIFAPAGAHLAAGISLRELGVPIDPADLQRLPDNAAQRIDAQIVAHIMHCDHFGNLVTNIPASMVPELFTDHALRLTFASHPTVVTKRRRFFADEAGQETATQEPFLYLDSAGYIGIAIQNSSAAALLGIAPGETITLHL